jgi:hypothetical protein
MHMAFAIATLVSGIPQGQDQRADLCFRHDLTVDLGLAVEAPVAAAAYLAHR